jgi:ferric-dicitrate binding protein FerR (iron transport regulator)
VSDRRDDWSDATPEDEAGRLLRFAGPRVEVSASQTERARSVVRASWQRRLARRRGRRRAAIATILFGAAAVLLVAVSRAPTDQRPATPGVAVARVEQVHGGLRVQRGDPVRTGDWIETDAASRVALRFDDGTSVRLDAASRVRALSAREVELTAGAVYVDTGGEHGRFIVRTPLATARDVGTQFEIRLVEETLRLRVRTGVVELHDAGRRLSGRAGTEIMLSSAAAVSRPIAIHGPDWEWASRLAPEPPMDGSSLAEYLRRLAREQGWSVEYADGALARAAEDIILHGAVAGLAPSDRVAVAVAASGLQHRLESGRLIVSQGDSRETADRDGRP